jgi:ATP-dependent Clp protease adaptor protein ClpS
LTTKVEYEFDIKTELNKPKQYKVILLNDDVSTMEFVVNILKTIFHKSKNEATKIMLNIHNQGSDICGIYSHEIAITKVAQVKYEASKANFPLKAIIEEVL